MASWRAAVTTAGCAVLCCAALYCAALRCVRLGLFPPVSPPEGGAPCYYQMSYPHESGRGGGGG